MGILNKIYHEVTLENFWENYHIVDIKGYFQENIIQKRIIIATFDLFNPEPACRLNGDDLKKVQFFNKMDPYQAFQNISMYVGGVLPRLGNPIVEIKDDRVKIHKAGFDTKISFRHRKNEELVDFKK